MKIKVCGMRDAENIREVSALGVDFLGLIFWPKSPRNVEQIHVPVGLLPDNADEKITNLKSERCKYVGVFVDEMPQNIVTRVYNFGLDYVQLHGNESPVMIENLKRTLIPDIAPDIKIIKALSIREKDDVKRWRQYENCVDLFLFDTKCTCVGGSGEQFDWSILNEYDGDIPFLLSGGIGPDDAERVKAFNHPKCIGIDLNSRFEIEPALKDVNKLKCFIDSVRIN